jgi:hypothetical protein
LVSAESVARSPSLVVVAFGTNEAYGRQFEVDVDPRGGPDAIDEAVAREQTLAHSYSRVVARLIETLQVDPERASCLVVLPPDFEEEDAPCVEMEYALTPGAVETACVTMPPRSLTPVRNGLETAAELVGCAVWDTQRAMGGEGWHGVWQRLTPALAARDGVHLTARGYDAMGAALYADLMRAYDRWRAGGSGDLETNPFVLAQ